jgi:small subunit ribosomal protein S6
MTDYEVTYILRPSLEENDVEDRANAIAEIIKGRSGEIVGIEKLGKKRLAYEIADVREGYYVVMQFKSDGAASKELERQMKLHEDVLRALVVKLDKRMLAHMAAMAQAAPPPPV